MSSSILVPSQLEGFDQELKDDEKEVLNEILTILICLNQWPSIEQPEAFLFLRGKENPGVPVEAELRNKYPQILTIQSNGTVEAAEIRQFFLDEEHLRSPNLRQDYGIPPLEEHDNRLTADHGLSSTNHGPSSTDHHLIHSSLDLAEDRAIVRPKIHFDYTQSYMVIIQSLLHAVCSEGRQGLTELKCFHGYASMRLLWHLWRVNVTGKLVSFHCHTTMALKDDIGKHLAKFFLDERTVGSWMSKSDPVHLQAHNWHLYVDDARTWINDDSSVGKGFEDFVVSTTHSILDETSSESEPEVKFSFVRQISKHRYTAESSNVEDQDTKDQCAEDRDGEGQNVEGRDAEGQDAEDQVAEGQGYDIEDGDGAKSLSYTSVEEYIPPYPLLHCVVKVLAFQWLQSYSWDARDAFRWLITIAYHVSFIGIFRVHITYMWEGNRIQSRPTRDESIRSKTSAKDRKSFRYPRRRQKNVTETDRKCGKVGYGITGHQKCAL